MAEDEEDGSFFQNNMYWRGFNNNNQPGGFNSGYPFSQNGQNQTPPPPPQQSAPAPNVYSKAAASNNSAPAPAEPITNYHRTVDYEVASEEDTAVMQWKHIFQVDMVGTLPALVTLPFSPGYTVPALGVGLAGYAASKIANDYFGRGQVDNPIVAPFIRMKTTKVKNDYVSDGYRHICQTIVKKPVEINSKTQVMTWGGAAGKIAGAGALWLSGVRADSFSQIVTSNFSPLLIVTGGLSTAYVCLRDLSRVESVREKPLWKTAVSSLFGAGLVALGVYAGSGSSTPHKSSYHAAATESTASAYVSAPAKLTLRNAPGGKAIGELSCGDEVKADLPLRQWSHVRLINGTEGYASGKFLSTSQPSCSPG